ncbi:hypothetical protein CXP34_23250 [Ralstonia mannitolilytica]|nr:hypothetical protein CXP34_23250 [Ralstonia mannitolilytica]
MKTIQVYDPALCCSTGVCGVEVDQSLVTFAADAEWAKQQGWSCPCNSGHADTVRLMTPHYA